MFSRFVSSTLLFHEILMLVNGLENKRLSCFDENVVECELRLFKIHSPPLYDIWNLTESNMPDIYSIFDENITSGKLFTNETRFIVAQIHFNDVYQFTNIRVWFTAPSLTSSDFTASSNYIDVIDDITSESRIRIGIDDSLPNYNDINGAPNAFAYGYSQNYASNITNTTYTGSGIEMYIRFDSDIYKSDNLKITEIIVEGIKVFSGSPTLFPTETTNTPSEMPNASPTAAPSHEPSAIPTLYPTDSPTFNLYQQTRASQTSENTNVSFSSILFIGWFE